LFKSVSISRSYSKNNTGTVFETRCIYIQITCLVLCIQSTDWTPLEWCVSLSATVLPDKTRKLSYRKDDRAMRPIYGCPKNFRESLSTPMATFAEIFNGLLFRSICVQNLNFAALPIPEIIGGTPKIWEVPGYAHAPFSPKFFVSFCSDGSC